MLGYRTAAGVGAAALAASSVLMAPPVWGDVAPPAEPRVVVAIIDSDINVYHEFYYEGGEPYPAGSPPSAVTPALLTEFGVGSDCRFELTRTGDFAADFQADTDSGLWAAAAGCDVVWFEGTNVLAKSFATERPYLPDEEGHVHGTGTSAALLRANPEAVLLFVEGVGTIHEVVEPLLGVGPVAEQVAPEFELYGTRAEEWTFGHPAVDIVSLSYGNSPFVSLPTFRHAVGSFDAVHGKGKLWFGAAYNWPTFSPADTSAGPWWSIAIAGYEEGDSNGRQMGSGLLPRLHRRLDAGSSLLPRL